MMGSINVVWLSLHPNVRFGCADPHGLSASLFGCVLRDWVG